MAKLKMVAGKTYMAPTVFGPERVINVGEVVDVPSEEHVALLLADEYMDALNNTHPYFRLIDGDEPEEEAPAKPAGKSRSRK